MPITELGATAIAAGATLFGQGANIYAQGKMNRKTRDWNDKQYARSRVDSLKDWTMQNEYNSPEAQMARYKAAGLNPALIYGQSNTADAVRSPDSSPWNPRAPEVNLDGPAIMSTYFDAKIKRLQADNFTEAIKTAQQQQANIAADTALKAQNLQGGKWTAENAAILGQTSLEAAKAGLRKINTETQISLNQDERNAALTSQSIKEGLARITKMAIENAKTNADKRNAEQLLKNLESDNQIKQLDIELKKQGLQPGDPAWMRIITQQWQKIKDKMPKVNWESMNLDEFKKGWNNSKNNR